MERSGYQYGRILIVDDEESNVRLLERFLEQAGYRHIASTTDPQKTLTLFIEFQPDLILLDLHMPYLDGFEVMNQLRQIIPREIYLPILVLTADISPAVRQQALAGGANDFLTKPLDAIEVLLRIKNLLQTRFLHLQLQEQNHLLEEKVYERTQELEEARVEILKRLALAAEYRDDTTGQHTQRVGRTAALLASLLGLPQPEVSNIRRAAPLHDVGKIGIPDYLLLKPGKLTPEEFEMMKTHTIIGAKILGGGQVPLLKMAEEIALTHHERWDGLGYPRGLAGEAIPLVGRIVAVADVFDALIHVRPYKPAIPRDNAIREISLMSGLQFDPKVVQAFLTLAHSSEFSTAAEVQTDQVTNVEYWPQTLPLPGHAQQDGELLTTREHEVLQYIAEGFTSGEIARTLGISVGTAEDYIQHIFHKLNVFDRSQIVIRALELKLIRLTP
ncbi:MAG: two-component system response regulator [Herpetosiphonaceae bacterium]|nr:MAG: two-component system response regulator [Herpetosiphonaceae bacterium]